MPARLRFNIGSVLMACLFSVILSLVAGTQTAEAQEKPAVDQQAAARNAIQVQLHGPIDRSLLEVFACKFQQAVDANPDVILVHIDSPGGEVDASLKMASLIMETEGIQTVAWIERDAISAAAFVSLACDVIAMRPGAHIGDAGMITMDSSGQFRHVPEKLNSLIPKVLTIAKANGRPVALVEKMSSKDMLVYHAQHKEDGTLRYISDKEYKLMDDADQWELGKPLPDAEKDRFLFVSGQRAVELGLADYVAVNEASLANQLNLKTPIVKNDTQTMDYVIPILNSRFMAVVLIMVGLIALLFELSAPGMSVGGIISISCFGLFFWSRFLGGTAGWLEVTLFGLGVICVLLEIFVVPGFGVAGISGMLLMFAGLLLASQRFTIPETREQVMSMGGDALTIFGGFTGFFIALIAISKYIGSIPGLSRLTLAPPTLNAAQATAIPTNDVPGWQVIAVGDTGKAVSPLRPSGKIQFNDQFVDVVSDGDFIDQGTNVKVVNKQGSHVVVRRA
ncbi:hypothetical protein SV7mr_44780 [Stieleria bergensis]|uniref:Uncharacterized protein n=2 Tax=Stieleria bergensis TaxID=2528025 RepID=A0A517T0M7_9BACT|nr:hypothetical protein SV7mr_44780 [Planctomycetes bacterium SV_7m_r]